MNSPLFNHVPDFLGEIKSLGATRFVDATSNLFRKSDAGQVLELLSTLDALISNLSVLRLLELMTLSTLFLPWPKAPTCQQW